MAFQIRVPSSEVSLAQKLRSMTLPPKTKTKTTWSSPPPPQRLGVKRIRSSSPRKRKRNRDLDAKISEATSPQLPKELIEAEILTRLPIKSAVRFQCVCKSWRSLFSDPQFVKQHSTHQNPNHRDCLVADRSGVISIQSRSEEIFSFRRDREYYMIGSANGLVCINYHNVLSLWNPAIRKSKEFHIPPLGVGGLVDMLGLGFDPISNDFKVAISYKPRTFDPSGYGYAVYSSNSVSWIHYRFDDPVYEMLISKSWDSLNPTTMVKDSPYWTCSAIVPARRNYVVFTLNVLKFDATSNRFKLLPRFSSDFDVGKIFKVLNMRDFLTLMAYEPCITGRVDVYSLDEDKGCGGFWSKIYRFGPFDDFWRLRDLEQGFKYGDEVVLHGYSKIYRYDQKTDTLKCIPGTKPLTYGDCYTYTPSLVFLQGMTSIYSENQSPPLGHHATTPQRLISSLLRQK
ncbi:F-box/kelch-repeat protein At3g23880-like [Daucus carota subsp. sativus]|uniref:F-box/kelch-repeat protein At3g23880-like n=1 Tax=Daucus carota subsp. sativus TaxID=79200 RepID=UPI0007F02A59|nr:PREDICTED: F-box/kelch-repeat protein At3g23880-like [Daucus carota subsp. sativus]